MFSKILSKWIFFIENHPIFLNFYDSVTFRKSYIIWKVKIINFHMHKYWLLWHFERFSILDIAINSHKHQNFCIFLRNNVCLLKILLSNLIFFSQSSYIYLFLTPKYTPPKVSNSKMGFNHIFFIHPVGH